MDQEFSQDQSLLQQKSRSSRFFGSIKPSTIYILVVSILIAVIMMIQKTEGRVMVFTIAFLVSFLILTAFFLKIDIVAVYTARCFQGTHLIEKENTNFKTGITTTRKIPAYKDHIWFYRFLSAIGIGDIMALFAFHTCKA